MRSNSSGWMSCLTTCTQGCVIVYVSNVTYIQVCQCMDVIVCATVYWSPFRSDAIPLPRVLKRVDWCKGMCNTMYSLGYSAPQWIDPIVYACTSDVHASMMIILTVLYSHVPSLFFSLSASDVPRYLHSLFFWKGESLESFQHVQGPWCTCTFVHVCQCEF